MIRMLSLFIFICSTAYLNAHNSKEAYFNIYCNNNQTIVEAEFPWTLRKALMTFDPKTTSNTDPIYWENAIAKYFKATLILSDNKNQELDLLSLEEIKVNGHSHQINYKFIFHSCKFSKVENTIMFNISDKQKNHHMINIDGISRQQTTTASASTFSLNEESNGKNDIDSSSKVIGASILIVIMMLLTIIKYRNAKNH